jgi:nucleoid DNA-binding protein
MSLLGRIYKKVLQEARASENKIEQAIDRHNLVIIRYNTHGEHVAMANRLCGVFAYGTTKAGNPCIRVFEYEGDTTTFVPGWKLIRLDRILAWFPTKRTVSSPPNDLFNPNGDNSMSMVYKVAKFDGVPSTTIPQGTKPTTASSVKTGQTKQQQQKQNTDFKKAQQGLKPYTQQAQTTPSNEPKTIQNTTTGTKERLGLGTKYANKPTMKTGTENAMDYLRQQLDNPQKIDLSKIGKQQNVKQANPTAQQPMTRQGVGQQYANKPFRKTDTENAMDYLRKQLDNPEKIDLNKVPKK